MQILVAIPHQFEISSADLADSFLILIWLIAVRRHAFAHLQMLVTIWRLAFAEVRSLSANEKGRLPKKIKLLSQRKEAL